MHLSGVVRTSIHPPLPFKAGWGSQVSRGAHNPEVTSVRNAPGLERWFEIRTTLNLSLAI